MKPRQFIEIKRLEDLSAQNRLPSAIVDNWATWFLDNSGSISKVPDGSDADGYVQPASIDKLCHPIDLKRPEMRPAIGFHV